MTSAVHKNATRKAITRLLPILFIAYFISFVDRTNVGLAKTALEADVGIGAAAYGLGAGIFFISYALLEIPSNLILHKIGPRRWIARIAITWGVISSAMMFTNSDVVFYVLRFLLGAAEAGLYPGLMYIVTVWFAQKDRARIVGYLMIGGASAVVLGSPIGGALMGLDGTLGLHGWQWLFLIEGIPAVVIGLVIWSKLPDRPQDAAWLTPEEATALNEEAGRVTTHKIEGSLLAGFLNPVILITATIYFLALVATFGVVFFTPAVVQSLGVTNSFMIGLLSGAIALGSVTALLTFPWLLRRIGNEVPLIAVCNLGTILAVAAFLAVSSPVAKLALLVCAGFFYSGVFPLCWSVAMERVSGKMAAGVLAFINTIGLLGGFVGPYLFGIAEEASGDPASGLYVVIGAGALSLVLIPLLLGSIRRQKVHADEIAVPA